MTFNWSAVGAMAEPPIGRWSAPGPKQLPDIRAALAEHTISDGNRIMIRDMIRQGKATFVPYVPGSKPSIEALGAVGLCQAEYVRLVQARLYYVDADMTALAVAAGANPPLVPMKPSRAPTPYGFMMFAEPIGGYTQTMAKALAGSNFTPAEGIEVTTPIVAVSWGPFDPRTIEGVNMDVPGATMRWVYHQPEGFSDVPPDHPGGIWVTFYAAGESPFLSLPPSTVLCYGPDGTAMTVKEAVEADARRPAVQWDNEAVMVTGAEWKNPPPPDTSQQWSQVVYTAWQLMAQKGKRTLVDTEVVTRDRAARKRDARAGGAAAVAEDNDVLVVRVHSNHRPPPASTEQDTAASTGRRAPEWSCRWPVAPHRRQQCFNPRGHASGDCEHDEVIIPPHIKGPAGKPLRVRDTVHLWDQMPEGWDDTTE